MIRIKAISFMVTLALFLQSGCDFWCPHLYAATHDETESAEPANCHEDAAHQGHKDHQETASDCFHPQASDDNSKLQFKSVKVGLFVSAIPAFVPETGVPVISAAKDSLIQSPPPTVSVLSLRI